MASKGRELDYDEVQSWLKDFRTNYVQVLEYIGQFGGFQKKIFLLLRWGVSLMMDDIFNDPYKIIEIIKTSQQPYKKKM